MAVRDSWAVQASGPTGLLDVEEARVALGALWTPGSSTVIAKSGFRPGPGASPGLVSATGTPDAFVHVAPFQLALQTSRAGVGGPYIMTLDAVFDVNVLSTPANATNPRDDLIIAQQSDTFYGDGVSTWTIRQVVGTPAGSPSDPAVSGSTDYVTLARVRVPANATTIVGANITDLRTSGHAKSLAGGLHAVALGAPLPVASQAQRDAQTGLYAGFSVWRTDLNPQRMEIWTGASWVAPNPFLTLPVGNKAGRDALTAFQGMMVWRNDLNGLNVSDGAGGWRYFVRPTADVVLTSQTTGSGSYTDLGTVGPSVSVETDTAAKVTLFAQISNNTATQFAVMGFAVSGASTVAANDDFAIGKSDPTSTKGGATFLVTGLTPGTNTFTAKYKVTGGTGTYNARRIMVEPC